jgi:tripartite ATP-independent transporter DctP family solute receptor
MKAFAIRNEIYTSGDDYMKRNCFSTVIVAMIFALILSACSSQSGSEAEKQEEGEQSKITLVAAHVEPTAGAYQAGMEKFKEVVERESNGSIEVEIHPNGALGGNDDELVQKLQTGTVDLITVAPGFLSQAVNEVGLFSAPYLFKDRDHWAKVLNGEVGQEMSDIIESKTDFKVLGFWIRGVRSYFGSKPVETPEDLQGIKIRVQNSPAIIKTWESFGAQPASVAFNELYQALQTGVVDAGENDFTNIYQMKFYEVAPNISLTEHEFLTPAFLMSQQKFDQLTEEQQQAIEKAAIEATKAEVEIDRKLNEESLQKLKEHGTNINKLDKEPFIQKTEEVRNEIAKQLGLEEMIQKIMQE